MASRPTVSVQGGDASIKMPAVFVAPIRPDIVQFVHTQMAKNRRQAYGVFQRAGMGHSAHSWGTGRAVSRIPRVSGGGTSRAGQAAFGNMCRKGRMFNPTQTWRKWHRKVNTNQKRYAVASALAASALPGLVMARGHQVSNVPEFPLVVANTAEATTRTKDAVALLKSVGGYDDVVKAKNSKQVRTGKGKMRNRRYTSRRGPLVVFANDAGITRAFRNLPGVDLAHVDRLNLLQLAPGGHLGRFIIWTADAFKRCNEVFGSTTRASTVKTGYTLPQNVMANSDLTRIINSDEIQSKVRAPKNPNNRKHNRQHKNPNKNFGVKVRLNPYALVQRRARILAAASKNAPDAKKKANNKKHAATKKANWARMSAN
jgi:large subunit ribosomal protein L4e